MLAESYVSLCYLWAVDAITCYQFFMYFCYVYTVINSVHWIELNRSMQLRYQYYYILENLVDSIKTLVQCVYLDLHNILSTLSWQTTHLQVANDNISLFVVLIDWLKWPVSLKTSLIRWWPVLLTRSNRRSLRHHSRQTIPESFASVTAHDVNDPYKLHFCHVRAFHLYIICNMKRLCVCRKMWSCGWLNIRESHAMPLPTIKWRYQ